MQSDYYFGTLNEPFVKVILAGPVPFRNKAPLKVPAMRVAVTEVIVIVKYGIGFIAIVVAVKFAPKLSV